MHQPAPHHASAGLAPSRAAKGSRASGRTADAPTASVAPRRMATTYNPRQHTLGGVTTTVARRKGGGEGSHHHFAFLAANSFCVFAGERRGPKVNGAFVNSVCALQNASIAGICALPLKHGPCKASTLALAIPFFGPWIPPSCVWLTVACRADPALPSLPPPPQPGPVAPSCSMGPITSNCTSTAGPPRYWWGQGGRTGCRNYTSHRGLANPQSSVGRWADTGRSPLRLLPSALLVVGLLLASMLPSGAGVCAV